MLAQKLQLCSSFHAFGQHFHAHALAHGNHRMADGHIVGAVGNIADKALVNFEQVNRKALEVRQR